MGFRSNYVDEINSLLMMKRFDGDVQESLHIPEHKFKKISEKFNYAIKTVYTNHIEKDIKMFHIILSLQNYFDMQWLIDNVLDNDNIKIVSDEMHEEYNIKYHITKKKKKICPEKKETETK
jgi:hypothetical protein